jgi:small subunit ribosomal protein S9
MSQMAALCRRLAALKTAFPTQIAPVAAVITPSRASAVVSHPTRCFATAGSGADRNKSLESEAEAEFAALTALTEELAAKSGAADGSGSDGDGNSVDSLLKRARAEAKGAYAESEVGSVRKGLSKTHKQYATAARKLAQADATASLGVKTHNLAANPYGWDIDTREVKQAPLWMLYEEARGEERITDKQAGKKPPQIDNDTELRVAMRDEKGRAYATGRRKTAVARVWVGEGDGKFTVNGKRLSDYFPRLHDRLLAMEPLVVTESCGAFDVMLTVASGGLTGQAGAVRHGLANAIARFDPQLKPVLRRCELLLHFADYVLFGRE